MKAQGKNIIVTGGNGVGRYGASKPAVKLLTEGLYSELVY